jgi:LPS sulfotransferase NodH
MDALLGISFRNWLKLLKENRFAVDRPYLGRAAFVTQMSLLTSIVRRKELRAVGILINGVQIQPPLFILGHWRSGTTLLHELIVRDEQFAYPNLFQVSHPHTCLYREKYVEKALANAKAEKRHMDNIQLTYTSPGEDEAALCVASLRSPLIAWSFPRREAFYDRYLTFENATEEEQQQWQQAMIEFFKKLTWRYGKPLALKSPTHTGKVRILLQMFPDAKFVHIHRNPYKVFQSTLGLYQEAAPHSRLQHPDGVLMKTGILRRYQMMFNAFFNDRNLIPRGNYCEVAFEDLVKDKVGQVAKIYEQLNIPGFDKFRPKLQAYVDSIVNYEKNVYQPLADEQREEIAREWKIGFDEWGYRTI